MGVNGIGGESDHRNVALHVKVIYFLIVVLILGEIGAYYYSLYLFRSVQEDCVSCVMYRGRVPHDDHNKVNDNNRDDDLILPKYHLRKREENEVDLDEKVSVDRVAEESANSTVNDNSDKLSSSAASTTTTEEPTRKSSTTVGKVRHHRRREKLIISSEGSVVVGSNDLAAANGEEGNVNDDDDDVMVYVKAGGEEGEEEEENKTDGKRDADDGGTDDKDDDDDVNSSGQRWKKKRRKRAGKRREVSDEPVVEFIPPQNGAQVDKNWVWLTSYSRIPVRAMQEFCQATKEYCPEGPQGPSGKPGFPGEKGSKGEPGDLGYPGDRGEQGRPGYPGIAGDPGQKGAKGERGDPGMDGLDGIPGAPGLDGIPGDKGIDGRNGTHGNNGTDGKNGLPGKQGNDGQRGPPGERGREGLPGPKGRRGTDGKPGTHGTPGVTAYLLNNTQMEALLVPSRILDKETERTVSVPEKGNAVLSCTVTGQPTPEVVWRREDNRPIISGLWGLSSVGGRSLEFPTVHREHSGRYLCIASNGLSPDDEMVFNLEVNFAPFIKIKQAGYGTTIGCYALLECDIEAFPISINDWSGPDGFRISHNDRYQLNTTVNGYKVHMTMNITNISSEDFGRYTCNSRNALGNASATIEVYETGLISRPDQDGKDLTSGETPPTHVDLPKYCPIPTPCATCQPPIKEKCPGDVHVVETKAGQYRTVGNLPPRNSSCLLHQVGTPVYNRYTRSQYGTWMKDPLPPDEESKTKFWVTRHNDSKRLYEYLNETYYWKDKHTKIHHLPFPFRGNSHVIYNGSFYYHHDNTSEVIRFDLAMGNQVETMHVPDVTYTGQDFLYKTTNYSYIDFAVDENGMWLIYGLVDSNNTVIMKFNPNTMEPDIELIISLNHREYGEMFIVCGVLYALSSVETWSAEIDFAYDIYNDEVMEVKIGFSNPFKNNTMVGYNCREKNLYSWDNGHQLMYPIRFRSRNAEESTKPTESAKATEMPNETQVN